MKLATLRGLVTTVATLALQSSLGLCDDSPQTVGEVNFTQLVVATNNTAWFQPDFTLAVNSSDGSNIMVQTDVAAMATESQIQLQNGLSSVQTICSGKVLLGSEVNANNIQSSSVVLLSCDNQTEAGIVMSHIIDTNPQCTIMYSLTQAACNFTQQNSIGQMTSQIGSIFTMLSSTAGQSILRRVQSQGSADGGLQAYVSPKSSFQTPKEGGSSNSTVALGVLYAITGVVAALFLIVIISGAVRVHNHPERYGLMPAGSNGSFDQGGFGSSSSGEGYSNRAKGLARAVLDSIPLVTFQVDNDKKRRDPEVQLQYIGKADNAKSKALVAEDVQPEKPAEQIDPEILEQSACSVGTAGHSAAPRNEITDCPICFEVFEDGEILRVLPCRHKFHAVCVDPWLLNTSSHCPLCRVDLSLQKDEHVSDRPPDEQQATDDELVIPPGYEVDTSLFNRFLDIWNAQLLPRDSRREVLARFQREAELRRQLRSQRNDQQQEQQQEQNRRVWTRFVEARRLLHQRASRRSTDILTTTTTTEPPIPEDAPVGNEPQSSSDLQANDQARE